MALLIKTCFLFSDLGAEDMTQRQSRLQVSKKPHHILKNCQTVIVSISISVCGGSIYMHMRCAVKKQIHARPETNYLIIKV